MNGILEDEVLDELNLLQPDLAEMVNCPVVYDIAIYAACKGCHGRASG